MADAAIRTGDLTQVKTLIVEEVEHQLAARLDHVLETQTGAKELQTIAEVPAARERASAELGFVTYVEGLRQPVAGAGHEHEE